MLNATGPLKIYAKYRTHQLRTLDPIKTQEEQLLRLVKKAEKTRFGSDHDFSSIQTVADFQKRVPLRFYEDFWKEYWQPA